MSEVDAEFMHHIIMCVNAVEVEVILTLHLFVFALIFM